MTADSNAAHGEIAVWDVADGRVITVTRSEAAAGMIRYARTLGPGSPACGELERQALELMRSNPNIDS